MIEIKLDDFVEWFQCELDKKYSDKLESLKRLFAFFFNLSNQIIILYAVMRDKMQKNTQQQDYKQTMILLNNSILVVSKMIQNHPKYIDYSFCQKFIKNFDINLNVLCSYYHSLNHVNLINEEAKFQKQKIVEGINKLYTIQSKIKQIFRANSNLSRILSLMNEYKKSVSSKIELIKRKSKQCKQKEIFLQNFQPFIVEFYSQYMSNAKQTQPKQEYKKNAIKIYFQLKNQLFSTQLVLQNLCKFPLQICEQTKEKKKNFSFILQQNCTTFSRWLGFLLKPNYSMKNFKKIKVQQLIKNIQIIVKQYPHSNNYLIQITQKNLQQIQNSAILIIDIVKELQKLQHSGILSEINQYKDSLLTNNCKKYVHKIIQYQNAMAKYFNLQEQIKKLKILAQSVTLQQIGKKINLIIEQE